MSDAPLPENTSYDDAVRELQDILQQMQSSELGIDALTSKLQRASTLLDFCQQRLTKTEAEVQAVLKRLGLEDAE
ncbi:MAG TPA: exodeoxyribonuclease VII small subunit [Flavobacteriales bacterium]|nr:exodeoxyribonuclease VII small subunit [Flavobacteriales bacterium]